MAVDFVTYASKWEVQAWAIGGYNLVSTHDDEVEALEAATNYKEQNPDHWVIVEGVKRTAVR